MTTRSTDKGWQSTCYKKQMLIKKNVEQEMRVVASK